MLKDDYIAENVKKVEKQLKMNVGDISPEAIKDSVWETANEIFLYLNHCPQENFMSLFSLFSNILNKSSKEIILSLANILKVSSLKPAVTSVELLAENLWIDLSKVMNLKNINMINEFTMEENLIATDKMFGNCTADCKDVLKTLGMYK